MDKADRPVFARLMLGLAETFRRDLSEPMVEGYWLGLSDLPLETVKAGIAACLKTSRFMPSPAEIRETSREPCALRAADDWNRVIGRVRGRRETASPIGEKVLSLMGGLAVLGDRSSEENDTWSRKEFMRLYELLDESARAIEFCLPSGENALITDANDPDAKEVMDEEDAVE